jgi:hypothetical protein
MIFSCWCGTSSAKCPESTTASRMCLRRNTIQVGTQTELTNDHAATDLSYRVHCCRLRMVRKLTKQHFIETMEFCPINGTLKMSSQSCVSEVRCSSNWTAPIKLNIMVCHHMHTVPCQWPDTPTATVVCRNHTMESTPIMKRVRRSCK